MTSLNHGIGFDTAAIELLLPTYGEQLGSAGQDRQALDAQPASDADPGDRVGLGRVDPQLRRRGRHGALRRGPPRRVLHRPGRLLRSNRVLCQLAGQYAVDMFIGASLQIDRDANSSTVTDGRLSGFGGAPNMGTTRTAAGTRPPRGSSLAHGEARAVRGRKLVVQMAQTFQKGGDPTFVESLDAVEVGRTCRMPIPPVMIYGDDVTHVVTEEGVAYLYKAHVADRRRGGAGRDRRRDTDRTGRRCRPAAEQLRRDGLVAFPEDLGVDRAAGRSVAAGRAQHRGPRRMVRRHSTIRRHSSGTGERDDQSQRTQPLCAELVAPTRIADAAVDALRAEALLTPKPGLVDARGSSAAMPTWTWPCLRASAEALRDPFARVRRCCPHRMPLGADLRVRDRRASDAQARPHARRQPVASTPTAGRCGRWGCWRPASRWPKTPPTPSAFAARLARLARPCPHHPCRLSHGEHARLRYGAAGAVGEAQAGFPHVVDHGLPTLRPARQRGAIHRRGRSWTH